MFAANNTVMLYSIFARVLVMFCVLPVHECAHGVTAYKLGDPTAKNQGRLTLNPFAHLDLFGSIVLVLTGFGWAKPVQVNPRNFKHPKRDMAVTSLAGPLSNILLSLFLMIVYKVLHGFLYSPVYRSLMASVGGAAVVIMNILDFIIYISLYLAVFNLLPIPPLDGSKIFGAILPAKYYFFMMKYERIVFVILLALLWFGVLSIPLRWLANLIYMGLDLVTKPIELLF